MVGQSQARPSHPLGFWPGLSFCKAWAAQSQGFQAKPEPAHHYLTVSMLSNVIWALTFACLSLSGWVADLTFNSWYIVKWEGSHWGRQYVQKDRGIPKIQLIKLYMIQSPLLGNNKQCRMIAGLKFNHKGFPTVLNSVLSSFLIRKGPSVKREILH